MKGWDLKKMYVYFSAISDGKQKKYSDDFHNMSETSNAL